MPGELAYQFAATILALADKNELPRKPYTLAAEILGLLIDRFGKN